MSKHSVPANSEIQVQYNGENSKKSKRVTILWQDDNYLIVNKPPFVLTNADPDSLEARLQKQLKDKSLLAVHRLDKETSGCVLFAKSAKAKENAIPLFKEHSIMKIYRAVTIGHFPTSWKDITTDIDGFRSVTMVKTLDSNKHASYLELRIETGRTHQIRRHLAQRRYPVLGDKKYAGTKHEISVSQPRQMLHAYRLIFNHPETGEAIRATAPLPPDFKECLNNLRLK